MALNLPDIREPAIGTGPRHRLRMTVSHHASSDRRAALGRMRAGVDDGSTNAPTVHATRPDKFRGSRGVPVMPTFPERTVVCVVAAPPAAAQGFGDRRHTRIVAAARSVDPAWARPTPSGPFTMAA